MSRETSEQRAKAFRENYDNHRDVVVIPPKKEFNTDFNLREELVGPYCRVSTLADEQAESYELQKLYYDELVSRHDNWRLVDIYADQGISATSMKRRKDLLRLIEDCKAGRVTLIITKSVTRFARNTVDCVSTCRMLKTLQPPVGVYFETENIYTLSQNSELQLDILSMLAQAESETKSTSIKWGIRSRFAKGIPRIVDLYGYIREGRNLGPDPETANVVRQIYEARYYGHSTGELRIMLHEKGVPSPEGNEWWSSSTLLYLLTNERYVGDVTMQKTVVVDLFTHKSVPNDGIIEKYHIYNNHTPIIDRKIWLAVQGTFGAQDWKTLLDYSSGQTINGRTLYPIKTSFRRGQHELVF